MHHSRETEGRKKKPILFLCNIKSSSYCLPTTQLFSKSLASLLGWYISFITLPWLWEILATQLVGTKRYRCFITVDGIPISANAAGNSVPSWEAMQPLNHLLSIFITTSQFWYFVLKVSVCLSVEHFHHQHRNLLGCWLRPTADASSGKDWKTEKLNWYALKSGTAICFFSRTVLPVGTRTLHTWLADPSKIVLGFLASKLASGRASVASWSAQTQKRYF